MKVYLKSDGTVWATGANQGQLGDGTTVNRYYPVQWEVRPMKGAEAGIVIRLFEK